MPPAMIASVTRVAAAEASELRTFGERGQKRVAGAYDRFDVLSRMTDLLRQVSRGSSPFWLSTTSHRVENMREILRRFVERRQWR
jgi:hypothetical protein